jgi:hypothetical protein
MVEPVLVAAQGRAMNFWHGVSLGLVLGVLYGLVVFL